VAGDVAFNLVRAWGARGYQELLLELSAATHDLREAGDQDTRGGASAASLERVKAKADRVADLAARLALAGPSGDAAFDRAVLDAGGAWTMAAHLWQDVSVVDLARSTEIATTATGHMDRAGDALLVALRRMREVGFPIPPDDQLP
jgi:hypothetical protein